MIIYAILAIIITSARDALVISKGITINHKGWKKWTVIVITHAVFFTFTGFDKWYFLMAFLIQVALFDISLNLMRGKKWNYMDDFSDKAEESLWSKIWRDKPILLLFTRLISASVAICLQIGLLL